MENRYDKYKDSGIEWIGEIPEHWEKICLKRLSNINTGNQDTQDSVSDGKYPFFVRSPKVERSNKYTFEGASILMAGDGVGAGKVFHLADDKFACHQRVYCINQFKRVNRIYLFYYLSSLFYHVIESANSKSTVDSVRLPMLAEFPVFMPIGFEQQSIATYLDQKCGEIDELIALQEEMITKLQSYKQSVITEAVTKGLDKNAPLKDSGVEWIGEIPEHWDICQLKRCSRFINGYAFNSNNFNKDYGVPVIRIGDIVDEQVSFENIVYVQENNELERFIVHKNDILIAMSGATVGKIGIYYAENKAYINQRVGIIRTAQYNFIKRMFATHGFIDYVILSSAGAAQPNISSDGILNFYIPMPLISEQQSIADYLDQKCGEIDKLISIKQQKIEKLKDYKKSLIFECVTGKRKVC